MASELTLPFCRIILANIKINKSNKHKTNTEKENNNNKKTRNKKKLTRAGLGEVGPKENAKIRIGDLKD